MPVRLCPSCGAWGWNGTRYLRSVRARSRRGTSASPSAAARPDCRDNSGVRPFGQLPLLVRKTLSPRRGTPGHSRPAHFDGDNPCATTASAPQDVATATFP